MDLVNLLRLGQIIEPDLLERAILDQLDWTPHPWRRQVGALIVSIRRIVTGTDNVAQGLAAQHPTDKCCTTPDMSTEHN